MSSESDLDEFVLAGAVVNHSDANDIGFERLVVSKSS